MNKKTHSTHIVFFVLLALVGGFFGGMLRPGSVTEKVYIEESSVIEAVDAIGPSVVSVISDSSPDSFSATAGSGFIISEEGLVVTNRHVVDDPETNYSVKLTDGRSFSVAEINTHPTDDLAILKLLDEAENLPTDLPIAELGDSDMLRAGQRVISMGTTHPEYNLTVSTGVVNFYDKSIQASNLSELTGVIVTDAIIHLGNSGGPLVNLNGEVIGINTALAATSGIVSFAIPINALKDFLGYLDQQIK